IMAAMGDDFLDVRTHGFARVAVSVPEVRVADPAFNAEAHLRLLEQVHREGAHYALCPELGLSGYSCADLFFQETLLAASLAALARVAEATAELAGATVLANLSASNVTVGKWEYRQELVRSSAAKNLAVQMYSAAGFGESTADLAWDGHGLIAERGEMIAETERFALHGSTVVTDVDLVALRERSEERRV